MRRDLATVVERRQLDRAVPPFQRPRQEPIGQMRVFWQERAVQVATVGVAPDRAFGPVLAVVAASHAHAPEGTLPGAEPGQPGMVLEADQVAKRRLDDDVANEPLRSRLGDEVEHADAGQGRPAVRPVYVAEELVAAADRQ